MGRNSKIAVVAIMALAIAGCAAEGEQKSSNPSANSTLAVKLPVAPKVTPAFNNPVVPPKQTPQTVVATASLIKPTNATERVVVVSKGRTDPFAQIIGQTISTPATNSKPVPVLPPLSGTLTKRVLTVRRKPSISIKSIKLAKQPKNKINKGAIAYSKLPKKTIRVMPKVLPAVIPSQSLIALAPPPPQPDLARSVLVTGVVLIGKQPQAIIKVPNEPTSRYVEAGQQLANGLLIKRIEMNEGSEPMVILEQYGIEVARTVGETPLEQTKSAAVTVFENPVSETSPLPMVPLLQNPVAVGAS